MYGPERGKERAGKGGSEAGASPEGRDSRVQLKASLAGMSYDEQRAALAPPASPVQRRQDGAPTTDGIRESAAQGVSGAGGALPHAETIQRAFGRHDVSGVQAHVGGKAAEATGAMGAQAYATGTSVAFADQPDLHTAAHEAAHVVQQRAGVSLSGGVGKQGDPYEQHADAVADAVVSGRSAEPLLDTMAGSGGGSGDGGVQQKAVQFYSEPTIEGMPWRVSDNGDMAIRQDSAVYGGRFFYARKGLISSANSALLGQKSLLQVEEGGDSMDVQDSSGGKVTLTRVEPSNRKDGSSGSDRATGMKWQEDCGVAANNVMQGQQYTGQGVYSEERKKGWLELVRGYLAGDTSDTVVEEKTTPERTYGTPYYTHRGRTQHSPQKMLNDIFEAVSAQSFDQAWEDYKKLSDADRETFDRQVGINAYAQPEVGEAYSIVANRDENIDQGVWNFHWGAVMMRSGGDSVTLENFAGSGEDAWDFQMYGPPAKKGQTFHEQQKQRTKHDGVTPEYGDNPTTIRVKPT